MDLQTAEPGPDTSMSRRRLVTRAGAAGIAGLAAAMLVDHTALASAAGPDEPNVPTASDMQLLTAVIGFELAASQLYGDALSNATDDLAVAVKVMSENHQAYAQAIAGATGVSAKDVADIGIVDQYSDAFNGSATDFFTAAHELEQTAVATHIDLLSRYDSADAIALTASIAVVEARHATVLADLLEVDDFDTLFGDDQTALDLTGADA